MESGGALNSRCTGRCSNVTGAHILQLILWTKTGERNFAKNGNRMLNAILDMHLIKIWLNTPTKMLLKDGRWPGQGTRGDSSVTLDLHHSTETDVSGSVTVDNDVTLGAKGWLCGRR